MKKIFPIIKSTFISSYFLTQTYLYRRYKRFHLGLFWIFFPTLMVLFGTIVSSKQLDLKSFGFEIHYTLWVILPFIVFRSITETIDIAQKLIQQCFILYRSVIIKNFQIVISIILITFIHIFLDLILGVIIIAYFTDMEFLNLLIFVYLYFLGLIIGLIVGLTTGVLSMLYYDIRFLNKIIRGAILFCTPIFYIMPKDGIVEIINLINPFTYLILASRDIIIYGFTYNVILCLIFSIPLFLILIFFSFKLKSYLKIINSTLVKGVVGQTYSWGVVGKTSIKNVKS